MPPWLFIWIARFGSGERFRKATPADWRFHTGFFVLIPIYMTIGVFFGQSFIDKASAPMIWIVLTLSMIVFLAIGCLWAKFIPAFISLILGVIAWATFAWLSWHHG
jgi:hypothetical protein